MSPLWMQFNSFSSNQFFHLIEKLIATCCATFVIEFCFRKCDLLHCGGLVLSVCVTLSYRRLLQGFLRFQHDLAARDNGGVRFRVGLGLPRNSAREFAGAEKTAAGTFLTVFLRLNYQRANRSAPRLEAKSCSILPCPLSLPKCKTI